MCSVHKIHYLWRPFLPDPKDDHVLELAVASGAKTITTADLKKVEKILSNVPARTPVAGDEL